MSPGSILVEGNGWDRYRLANPAYFDDYVRHGFLMGRLGTESFVTHVVDAIGDDNLVTTTDYPHTRRQWTFSSD